MYDREAIERIGRMRQAWEAGELRQFVERQPESRAEYRTASGLPRQRVYTPEDVAGAPYEEIGLPGQYPFTRGPYPTMYRGRLWTMRQIAGYGTGADTNGRFRYLIAQGQTGLSVDFDMPTLMGYDSDDPRSLGEVGREGVAVDTLDDVAALFDGIDLERISVSMTINPTAWILLAMYVALAESRGLDLNRLSGTVQADILKEYIAQKEWIFPIRPSMRLMRDMIAFSAERMARYNPVNISGYHISEAGANAVQEVAFTMANGIAYVEEVTRGGRAGRRLRVPARLLLHRAGGLLRGGGQVPRRAADLGEDHAGALRRPAARVDAPPVPLPDGGGHPHQGAAHGQRGADRLPGALRRPRRARSRSTPTGSTRPTRSRRRRR